MSTAVAPSTTASELEAKIQMRTARAGVVGMGDVGLPLAVEFATAGFHVTGILGLTCGPNR